MVERKTQIFADETLAALCVPHTVPDPMRGHVKVHFVDNHVALRALVCSTTMWQTLARSRAFTSS